MYLMWAPINAAWQLHACHFYEGQLCQNCTCFGKQLDTQKRTSPLRLLLLVIAELDVHSSV